MMFEVKPCFDHLTGEWFQVRCVVLVKEIRKRTLLDNWFVVQERPQKPLFLTSDVNEFT